MPSPGQENRDARQKLQGLFHVPLCGCFSMCLTASVHYCVSLPRSMCSSVNIIYPRSQIMMMDSLPTSSIVRLYLLPPWVWGGVELSKDALSTPLESACGVCTSRYLGVTPTPPQCTSHSYCLNSNSSRRCQKPTTLLLQYLFVSTSCVRTVFFFCIIATSLN